MRKMLLYLSTGIIIFLVIGCVNAEEPIKVTLNGMEIIIDSNTGSIIGLSYSGPDKMLEATLGKASIIDIATPIEQFEPLRLASRYSQNAKITQTNDEVTIHWDKLGASRKIFEQPGSVLATVTK